MSCDVCFTVSFFFGWAQHLLTVSTRRSVSQSAQL